MAVVRVNITLQPSLLEIAKAYAADKGQSLSALIQELLEKRIREEQDLESEELFDIKVLEAIRTSSEIRDEINKIMTEFMSSGQ